MICCKQRLLERGAHTGHRSQGLEVSGRCDQTSYSCRNPTPCARACGIKPRSSSNSLKSATSRLPAMFSDALIIDFRNEIGQA
ncbi:hypothetical protein AOLI_G00313800 [Acnodon oligacanthus]